MSSMIGSEKPKRYSSIRYWRYIFTPFLLFTVLFGLYMLFTMSDAQSASYDNLLKVTSASVLTPAGPFGSNILRTMEKIHLGV